MEHSVLPLIRARGPQAIMLQCGADALEEDPLARLSLSNNALWAVVAAIRDLAPRLVVVGGGGYNPYTVGRAWAGNWATLNGLAIPARTTPDAEAVLRGLHYNRAAGRTPPEHWFTTLRDAPREGQVRDEVGGSRRPRSRRRLPHECDVHCCPPMLSSPWAARCAARAQPQSPTQAQPELPREKLVDRHA